MRLITNEKVIKRNALIGRVASLAGLIILLSGLLVSIISPPTADGTRAPLPIPFEPLQQLAAWDGFQFVPLITLLVGFLVSQLGILFSNRWVRPPRPDEALDAALKGLDDRHVIYHYRLHASHVLVAPSGVYVLLPKRQGGQISFSEGKWRQAGHNKLLAFFAQDSIGNPTSELNAEVKSLESYLGQKLPEAKIPVKGIVVFTDTASTVSADEAPVTTLHTKKLKDYIRRQPKAPTLSRAMLSQLNEDLGLTGPAVETMSEPDEPEKPVKPASKRK